MQNCQETFAKRRQSTNVGHHGAARDKPPERARVVVIGAGLAGLAAAQRLHEQDIDEVVVLEALERIGGRVHTIEHGDYLLELGAQWLHGADENPLYKWLASHDMLDDFEDASLGFRGIFCTSDGKRQVEPQLVDRVLDMVRHNKMLLSKNTDSIVDIVRSKGLKNASEVFRHQLELQLSKDTELCKSRTIVMALFEWFLRYETIENCCDSMEQVSIASYTDWADLGDGTLLNFKHGYRSLLQWFRDRFPADNWLYCGKQVLQVELLVAAGDIRPAVPQRASEWFSPERGSYHSAPILVHYKQADCEKVHSIECDHVIVTSSLGFLKQNQARLFSPPLAKWRRELIDSIGFGTVNKIVLEFEESFWNEGIKLVWPAEWRQLDKDQNDIETEELPSWTRDIIAFDSVRRQPKVLLGWIGGQGAKQLEEWSDAEIGQICLRLFDKFLPETHRRPGKLLACFCSRWHSNEFIRGSYSFQSMQSYHLNTDKLHEPIYTNCLGQVSEQSNQERSPRVLFAGEATACQLYSTTHGAIISGWREADRLRDHTTSSNASSRLYDQKANATLTRPVPRIELTNDASLMCRARGARLANESVIRPARSRTATL